MLAGKYRVERVLGEGGMGVVVAALDTTLERRVAIKFLLPEYAEHVEACARFMREARAAVKIRSEHIARVIDVCTMEGGSPYMVMEFLEGQDLSQVLAAQGPLPVEQAAGYVLEACDAVAEAHACGIVHRDLKPANLFLARQSDGTTRVKVLDFGISKNTLAVPGGTDPALTRTSSMMGSPLYMSPEQMRSTKDVDARSDIWSLGVILFELLEAQLPFSAASIPELSAKILLEDAQTLSRTDAPPALRALLARALEKTPSKRFQSVAEFAAALAAFAPARLSTTVERISRVLESAGMGAGGRPQVAAGKDSVGRGAAAPDGTGGMAGWGSTRGPAAGARKWLWSVSAAAAALAVGFIVVRGQQTADVSGGVPGASPAPSLGLVPSGAAATTSPDGVLGAGGAPVDSKSAAPLASSSAEPPAAASASAASTNTPAALLGSSTAEGPSSAASPRVGARSGASTPLSSAKPGPSERPEPSAAGAVRASSASTSLRPGGRTAATERAGGPASSPPGAVPVEDKFGGRK